MTLKNDLIVYQTIITTSKF